MGGETLFETVCLSLFPSLLHNRVLWKEIYQVRGYGFGAQFLFSFFERSIFDSLVEREMKEAREPEKEIFLIIICKAMEMRLFSPKASYK